MTGTNQTDTDVQKEPIPTQELAERRRELFDDEEGDA